MENREQVSYEEFVAAFGSPGILTDVDWGFTYPSYRFNWRSENASVGASFENGYVISILVTTF